MDSNSVAVSDGAVVEARHSQPDCSPHPFVIMAIFALYQAVP